MYSEEALACEWGTSAPGRQVLTRLLIPARPGGHGQRLRSESSSVESTQQRADERISETESAYEASVGTLIDVPKYTSPLNVRVLPPTHAVNLASLETHDVDGYGLTPR